MRTLLTILATMFAFTVSTAQEADSLSLKPTSVRIEDLVAKLDKLQHDYDYLKLEQKLEVLNLKFKIDLLDIDSNAQFLSNLLDERFFKEEYYSLHKAFYELSLKTYEQNKELVANIDEETNQILNISPAEEMTLLALKMSLTLCLESIEGALNIYKSGIDSYYRLR